MTQTKTASAPAGNRQDRVSLNDNVDSQQSQQSLSDAVWGDDPSATLALVRSQVPDPVLSRGRALMSAEYITFMPGDIEQVIENCRNRTNLDAGANLPVAMTVPLDQSFQNQLAYVAPTTDGIAAVSSF